MKERDVVFTPIPQADGRIKSSPVIILRELPFYRDFLVCDIIRHVSKKGNIVRGLTEVKQV